MIDSDSEFDTRIKEKYNKKIEKLTSQMVNEEITHEEYEEELKKLRDELEEKTRKHYAEMTNKGGKKMTPEEATEKLVKLINEAAEREELRKKLPQIKEFVDKNTFNPNAETNIEREFRKVSIAYALAEVADRDLMESLENRGAIWYKPSENELTAAHLAADANNIESLMFFQKKHPEIMNLYYTNGEKKYQPLDFANEEVKKALEKKPEDREEDVIQAAQKKYDDLFNASFKDDNPSYSDENLRTKLIDFVEFLEENKLLNNFDDGVAKKLNVKLGLHLIYLGRKDFFDFLESKYFNWEKVSEEENLNKEAKLSQLTVGAFSFLKRKDLLKLNENIAEAGDEPITVKEYIKKYYSDDAAELLGESIEEDTVKKPEEKSTEEHKEEADDATKKLIALLQTTAYDKEKIKASLDEIKDLIIKQGADVNTPFKVTDFKNDTSPAIVLAVAADSQLMESIVPSLPYQKFVEGDMDARSQMGIMGYVAAQNNNEDVLKVMADKFPRVMYSKIERPTRSEAEIKPLVEFIVDENLRNKIKETLKKGQEKATKELTNLLDNPSYPFADSTRSSEACELIQKRMADVNAAIRTTTFIAPEKEGGSFTSKTENYMVAHWIAEHGNKKLLELADKDGIKWDVRHFPDDINETVIHMAAKAGNEAALKFFVEKGLDFSQKDKEGKTALERIEKAELRKKIEKALKAREETGRESDVEKKPAEPEPTPDPAPSPESTPEPAPDAHKGEEDGEKHEEDGTPHDGGSGDKDGNAEEEDGTGIVLSDEQRKEINRNIGRLYMYISTYEPDLFRKLVPTFNKNPEEVKEFFDKNPDLLTQYKDVIGKIGQTEDGKKIIKGIFPPEYKGPYDADALIKELTTSGEKKPDDKKEGEEEEKKTSDWMWGRRTADALKDATDIFCKNVFEKSFDSSEQFAQAALFNMLAYPLEALGAFLSKEYGETEKDLLKKIHDDINKNNGNGGNGNNGNGGNGGNGNGNGSDGDGRVIVNNNFSNIGNPINTNTIGGAAGAGGATGISEETLKAFAKAAEARAEADKARAEADAAAAKAIAEANSKTAEANQAAAEANQAAAEANQATAKANEENARAFTSAIGELANGMKEAAREQSKQFAEAFDKISKENREFLEKNSAVLTETVEKLMKSDEETRKMISDSLKEAIAAFKEGKGGDSTEAVQKVIDSFKDIMAEREKTEQERIKQENETKRQLAAEETARTEIREQGKTDRAEINAPAKLAEAERIAEKGSRYYPPNKPFRTNPKTDSKTENLPFELPEGVTEEVKKKILRNYNRVLNSEGTTEEKAKNIAKFLSKIEELKPEIEKVTKAYDLIANYRDLLDDMHLVKKGARKGELHRNDIKKLEKEGLDLETVKMAMGLRKRLEKGSRDGDPKNKKRGKGRS